MQWAKLPRPTRKVSIQMIMTEPVMECEPETSQAASAMIQPPITPDQKTVCAGVGDRVHAKLRETSAW